MLALAGVPSILMFVGMLFVPETPRWLVFHGKMEKAQQVLAKLHDTNNKWKEYQLILADYEEHTKTKLSKVYACNLVKGNCYLRGLTGCLVRGLLAGEVVMAINCTLQVYACNLVKGNC